VPISLKYAVVERERRYLVASLPDGVTSTTDIVDRYVTGTRLRLREVREGDGTVVRKLGHKVRLGEGPREVACTNLYLDDEEWALLTALPARTLRKKRHLVVTDAWTVAIDEHEDGTLVAEIDDRDDSSDQLPEWLEVVRDVTDDEAWTGARLAH
jgi:CYTH domain-containing protein